MNIFEQFLSIMNILIIEDMNKVDLSPTSLILELVKKGGLRQVLDLFLIMPVIDTVQPIYISP